MNIPASVRPLWDRFVASTPYRVADRYSDTFFFGDTESLANELANELAALVLAGCQ